MHAGRGFLHAGNKGLDRGLVEATEALELLRLVGQDPRQFPHIGGVPHFIPAQRGEEPLLALPGSGTDSIELRHGQPGVTPGSVGGTPVGLRPPSVRPSSPFPCRLTDFFLVSMASSLGTVFYPKSVSKGTGAPILRMQAGLVEILALGSVGVLVVVAEIRLVNAFRSAPVHQNSFV